MIIATKLHIPRLRTEIVTRPRLTRRLHEGLNGALTMIAAPAGYGKTTLLSEWAMSLEGPVAWVSMDMGDNDRMRFWTHTIAALKQAYPAFNAKDVLRFAEEGADSFIAALINGLHRTSHAMVLVWDDFHHIKEPAILAEVQYVLERLPAQVHLYISSRTIPPFSLSRFRTSSGLIRVGAQDLRFLPEETTAFFTLCGGMKLSVEEASTVQEKTEGWAAAMRLAALSMGEQAYPASLFRKLSGTEHDISDYFFEEVLSRQPEAMQQFLLRTSILERMTGELCQAVTGMTESTAYLQRLEQASLFLIPLDERREWYRYHHLFQQFLAVQFKRREPLQWKSLHMAAGIWLEENGYAHEAVNHYLAGAGYEEALTLLEAIAPKLMIHEWATLCAWLTAIPDSLFHARPTLLLTKLASQYISGQVEEATDGYWRAVRRLEEDTAFLHSHHGETLQAGLAFLAAFRTFLDRDFDYAVQFSEEYVRIHPEGNFFIGFGSDREGCHPVWDIHVTDDSLALAERVLNPLLSIWSGTRNVYFVAHLCIDYGQLQYERNQLNEAEKYMRRAYDIGSTHDNPSLAAAAAFWLARIAAAQGDAGSANVIAQELARQSEWRENPRLSGKTSWYQAMLGRLLGEEKLVRQWLKGCGLRALDEIPLSMIKEYDLFASLHAEHGKIKEAITITDRLLFITSQAGRQGDHIRLLVHKSRILFLQGKAVRSMDVLEEALALAWPEGYIRTFVDEGASFRALLDHYLLLRQHQHHRPERRVPLSYVKRLLRLIPGMREENGDLVSLEGGFPSLTAKEKAVLALMEQGMSNKEVALHLNVSLATVKTHINNIYGKLQAGSRLQALERARTLRLF